MSNGKIVSNIVNEINLIAKRGRTSELEFLMNLSNLISTYRKDIDRQPIILESLEKMIKSLNKISVNNEEKERIQENRESTLNSRKILNNLLVEIDLMIKKEKDFEILRYTSELLSIFKNNITDQFIITESLKNFNLSLQKISPNINEVPENQITTNSKVKESLVIPKDLSTDKKKISHENSNKTNQKIDSLSQIETNKSSQNSKQENQTEIKQEQKNVTITNKDFLDELSSLIDSSNKLNEMSNEVYDEQERFQNIISDIIKNLDKVVNSKEDIEVFYKYSTKVVEMTKKYKEKIENVLEKHEETLKRKQELSLTDSEVRIIKDLINNYTKQIEKQKEILNSIVKSQTIVSNYLNDLSIAKEIFKNQNSSNNQVKDENIDKKEVNTSETKKNTNQKIDSVSPIETNESSQNPKQETEIETHFTNWCIDITNHLGDHKFHRLRSSDEPSFINHLHLNLPISFQKYEGENYRFSYVPNQFFDIDSLESTDKINLVITLFLSEDEVNKLAVDEDTIFELEDGNALNEEIEDKIINTNKERNYFPKMPKVKIPFFKKIASLKTEDIKFAKIITDFYKNITNSYEFDFVEARNYLYLNFVSNNKRLDIKKSLELIRIFMQTGYEFEFNSSGKSKSMKNFHCFTVDNICYINSYSRESLDEGSKDLGFDLDIKNGLCSEENVRKFYNVLLNIYNQNETVQTIKEDTLKKLEQLYFEKYGKSLINSSLKR